MRYYDGEPLQHVGDVPAMAARRYGDDPALYYHDDVLSFAALAARTDEIANGLVEAGVEPDDRVAIAMENNLRYVPILFGAARAGAVPVPVNYRMDAETLEGVLDDAGADVLFGSEHLLETVLELHDAADLDLTLVPGGADADGVVDYDDWIGERPAAFEAVPRDFEDDVAIQCYTSGTTGDPKGVLLTHENVLSALQAYDELMPIDPQTDTAVTFTPMFHVLGLVPTTGLSLYTGRSVVVRNLPDPENLLAAITRHDATNFHAVPALYVEMVQEMEANPEAYDVSSLKEIGVGGAPTADDTRRRIEAAFGLPLTEGWAMTETASIGTSKRAKGVQKEAGCVGQPLRSVELKLVDPETRATRVPAAHLDPHTPPHLTDFEPDFDDETTHTGEIAIRGPPVFDGYHDRPEANAEAFDDDGWFYTGDVARVDEDRFLWIVDRVDDMFVVGGENVYPAEVEDPLCDHEAVEEAAVVPVDHEVKGKAPVAYVVLGDAYEAGADVTEKSLRTFALDNVPTYAHPRRVFFVDELPRGGTDKVQRFELEERAAEEIGELEPSDRL